MMGRPLRRRGGDRHEDCRRRVLRRYARAVRKGVRPHPISPVLPIRSPFPCRLCLRCRMPRCPPPSLLPTPDCSSFRSKPPPPSCCSRSPMGHQIDDLGAKIKTVSSDPDGAPCLRSYFDSSILTPSGSDCR